MTTSHHTPNRDALVRAYEETLLAQKTNADPFGREPHVEAVEVREQVAHLRNAVEVDAQRMVDPDHDDQPLVIESFAARIGALCDIIVEKTERWQCVRRQSRERTS